MVYKSSINNRFEFWDNLPAKAVHKNKNNKCWLKQVLVESQKQLNQFTYNIGY